MVSRWTGELRRAQIAERQRYIDDVVSLPLSGTHIDVYGDDPVYTLCGLPARHIVTMRAEHAIRNESLTTFCRECMDSARLYEWWEEGGLTHDEYRYFQTLEIRASIRRTAF